MKGSTGSGDILFVIVLNLLQPFFSSITNTSTFISLSLFSMRNVFHFFSGIPIMPFLLRISNGDEFGAENLTRNTDPFSMILKLSGAILHGIIDPE